MSKLALIPQHLRQLSISPREVVLPLDAALEAIDFFESNGIHILGWEGWIQTKSGQVGHGSAPQGTCSLERLSIEEAAQLCRSTIPPDAAAWALENPDTTDKLYFCITVRARPAIPTDGLGRA